MPEDDFDIFEWVEEGCVKSPSPPPTALRVETNVPADHAGTGHGEISTTNRSSSQASRISSASIKRSPTDHEQRRESGPNPSSDSSASTVLGDKQEPRASRKTRCRPAGASRDTTRRQSASQNIQSRPQAAVLDPGNSIITFYNASADTQGRLPKEDRKRRRLDQDGDNYRAVRERGVCPGCWMRNVKCNDVIPCRQCMSRNYSADFCCRDRVNKLSTHHPTMATKFVDVYKARESIQCWDEAESPRVIELCHGLNHTSFRITVTKYIPREAITDLFWKKPNGWQQLEHTPWGIRNEKRDLDAQALDEYVWAQIPHVLNQIREKESNRTNDSGEGLSDIRPAQNSSRIWLETMQTVYEYLHGSFQPDSAATRPLRTSLTLWTYTFLQYHGLWQFKSSSSDDTLGMIWELGSHSKDTETLTPFQGTTPLPRFLSQQLHSCIEGRMAVLEKSLQKDLHAAFKGPRYNWPVLYLTTWVYLSILEEIVWDAGRWTWLSKSFDWPMEESIETSKERAEADARTIIAHYRHAFRLKPLSDLYKQVFTTQESAALQGSPIDPTPQALQDLLKETCSFVETDKPSVERRKSADFDKDDIRSLELKFASMMVV